MVSLDRLGHLSGGGAPKGGRRWVRHRRYRRFRWWYISPFLWNAEGETNGRLRTEMATLQFRHFDG